MKHISTSALLHKILCALTSVGNILQSERLQLSSWPGHIPGLLIKTLVGVHSRGN